MILRYFIKKYLNGLYQIVFLIIFQATFVLEEYLVYLHGSYEESGQVYIAIYILGYFLEESRRKLDEESSQVYT